MISCQLMLCRVGLACPLFNVFLPQHPKHASKDHALVPANVVYMNYLIISIAGLFGNFIAYYTVDMPRLGIKGAMAISTLIAGLSLFLFILSPNATWQTCAACIQSLFSISVFKF